MNFNNIINTLFHNNPSQTLQNEPGNFTYYQQKGIKNTRQETPPESEEPGDVEMTNVNEGEPTVEIDLDELRQQNLDAGQTVDMPTEVPPENPDQLTDADFTNPPQNPDEDLLGLNEAQENDLNNLLNEDIIYLLLKYG